MQWLKATAVTSHLSPLTAWGQGLEDSCWAVLARGLSCSCVQVASEAESTRLEQLMAGFSLSLHSLRFPMGSPFAGAVGLLAAWPLQRSGTTDAAPLWLFQPERWKQHHLWLDLGSHAASFPLRYLVTEEWQACPHSRGGYLKAQLSVEGRLRSHSMKRMLEIPSATGTASRATAVHILPLLSILGMF